MSKLTSLSEAVRALVRDGDLVYPAGFTHLIPFAAGHEMIRQGRKNLTIARATPDLVCDQLVAAGCVRKVIFSYMGNPGVGSLRVLRAAIEEGTLEWEEYSHFAMITRLLAGAAGLPFLPMKPAGVEDLERANGAFRRVVDPFSGRECIVVPPLNPDVAFVHAQRADVSGDGQIWGIIGEQKEAAFAADRVILTVEEIVSEDVIRSDPNRTLIPGMIVDAVCHVPYGAHPSYTQGYYDRDNDFYIEWDRLSGNGARLAAYLDEWVREVATREEYWRKLGPAVHRRLAVEPRPGDVVDFGDH